MNAWRRWQDYGTILLGAVLFVTPFVFGDAGQTTAAYTAYVLGVVLFLSGLLTTAMNEAGNYEAIPVVLGVIIFIAPWVLGFVGVTALAWSSWVIGVLAVLVAGSLLVMRNRPARLAQ